MFSLGGSKSTSTTNTENYDQRTNNIDNSVSTSNVDNSTTSVSNSVSDLGAIKAAFGFAGSTLDNNNDMATGAFSLASRSLATANGGAVAQAENGIKMAVVAASVVGIAFLAMAYMGAKK